MKTLVVAAAHVDDVVVGAGEGAGGDDAQPLEVVGEAGPFKVFGEELHKGRGFDDVQKSGGVGDGFGAAVELAAFAFGDNSVQ